MPWAEFGIENDKSFHKAVKVKLPPITCPSGERIGGPQSHAH